LFHLDGVCLGCEPDQPDLPDRGGVWAADLEGRAVADACGGGGDFGAGGELAGAVLFEQVGRGEDFGVLGQVVDLVTGAADAAAGGEHAAVGEQQGGGVVLAGDGLGGEGRPLTGGGVPALGVVDAAVHVDQARPGRVAACGQHAPVREQGQVVLATTEGHRRARGDLRCRPVGVDHNRGFRGRPAAGHECLADVVDGVAAVIAVDRIALAEALPGAAATGVESAQRLTGPRIEDATIGGNVQPGIERQVQRSGTQCAQAAVALAHLRDVGAALGDQHLPVCQRRHRRIPAAGGHIRPQTPAIARRVEQMRLHDPFELRVLVPTSKKQRPVKEVSETGAEDVETRVDSRRRMCPRDRVEDGGPGEIVNREGLGRSIADRVEGKHLPVRKQSDMNTDDGPVDDRPPLPDLTGIGDDCGGSRLRGPAGQQPRLPTQLPLEHPGMDDRVLGPMPHHAVDVVRQHRPRNTKRQHTRQHHNQHATQAPAARPNTHTPHTAPNKHRHRVHH
jgi:hypothetical protein